MSKPISLADRQLSRDLLALLEPICDALRRNDLPRWLCLVISNPLRMMAQVVRDFTERREAVSGAVQLPPVDTHQCGARCGLEAES